MPYFETLKTSRISVVLLFLIFIHLSVGATITDISKLRADLLKGYDPLSRPVQNHENATVVRIDFRLTGFDLNERTSMLNVYAFTVMSWEDEHLRWDPADYGNLTHVHFSADELWKPDLTVHNNRDESEIDHFANNRLVVYGRGNTSFVYWVPPSKFQVDCQTDLRKWPYDTVWCRVIIGSWAHDGSMINVKIPPNVSAVYTYDFKPNREWDLLGTFFEKREYFYDSTPGVPFQYVYVWIEIARKSESHHACIVVPGLVIAAAVLVAFWLPPGSSERLSTLLVAILINVLDLYYIYSIIPNNGDSVPLVLLFYRDSLVMLAFALIWTISLRYLAATKRNSPVPLPGVIVTFLNSIPAKILCLDPRPSTGGGAQVDDTSGGDAADQNEITGNGGSLGGGVEKNVNPFQQDWAWLAHLLDRVAFLIYLIIYLCFYLALL